MVNINGIHGERQFPRLRRKGQQHHRKQRPQCALLPVRKPYAGDKQCYQNTKSLDDQPHIFYPEPGNAVKQQGTQPDGRVKQERAALIPHNEAPRGCHEAQSTERHFARLEYFVGHPQPLDTGIKQQISECDERNAPEENAPEPPDQNLLLPEIPGEDK